MGIYSLVVLLSWWCSLLRAKPEIEHIDCLRTLEEVNRALVATVNNLKNRPTASISTLSAPATPHSSSRSRKQENSEELAPQKQKRCGPA